MTVILCGWCGQPTADEPRCASCGRDPRKPWEHRGADPPVRTHDDEGGRPELEAATIRQRYQDARAIIEGRGQTATVEALAEELDRSPRTVRDWRRRFALE